MLTCLKQFVIILNMKEKKFKYQRIKDNLFRFVGYGSWINCREFIVNEFNCYRQWIILVKEHYGKKINHYDVKILFQENKNA